MNKLFIGFAAGIFVGVLFAPDKGSETRERIARRGKDLKNKFNDLVDSLSSKFEEMADEVDEFAEKAKQKARSQYAEPGSTWGG